MRRQTGVLFAIIWLEAAGDRLECTETPSRSPEAERLILQASNEFRLSNNLPALIWDQTLSDIAYRHSEDMILRSYFDHLNPDAQTPDERIHRQHRRFIGNTGENLSVVVGAPPLAPASISEQAIAGWLRSPPHRANILDKAFTHAGIGVAVKGVEAKITLNFMQVRGILESPIPEILAPDYEFDLRVVAFPPKNTKPKRYVLQPLQPDPKRPDPATWPLSTRRPLVKPGRYTIQFCFPVPRSKFLEVFPGPQIEILE
ncbi:MAG TPA: CAP domain-containing protein [Acidobacteriota bacterium]|nr:CAP domain-containing protein [Acidobacteriota bacterium]